MSMVRRASPPLPRIARNGDALRDSVSRAPPGPVRTSDAMPNRARAGGDGSVLALATSKAHTGGVETAEQWVAIGLMT